MYNIDFDIKKTKLCEVIADKLEAMILSDSTKIEQKLPSEQSLASSFGVSRPIIREALALLKARGLITPKNGEGSFISNPTVENLTQTINRMVHMQNINPLNIFSVRITLEIMSVRLASEIAVKNDIETLTVINDRMRECAGDIDKRTELDVFFHAQIAEISGNPLLAIFVNSLATLLLPIIKKSLLVPGASEDGILYHTKIIEILKTHDPDAAADIIRNHLTLSMRNYESMEG